MSFNSVCPLPRYLRPTPLQANPFPSPCLACRQAPGFRKWISIHLIQRSLWGPFKISKSQTPHGKTDFLLVCSPYDTCSGIILTQIFCSFSPSSRSVSQEGKKPKHFSAVTQICAFLSVVLSFIDSERCVMTTKCNQEQLNCVQIWRML